MRMTVSGGRDRGGDDGRRGRSAGEVGPPGGAAPGDAGVDGERRLAHQRRAGEQQGHDAGDDGDDARERRHGRCLASCVTLRTLTRTSSRARSRPVSRATWRRTAASAASRTASGVGERPGPDRHAAAQLGAALEELDLGAHHVGVGAAGGRRGRPLEVVAGHQHAAVAGRRRQPQGVGVVAQHQPDEAGQHRHAEQPAARPAARGRRPG